MTRIRKAFLFSFSGLAGILILGVVGLYFFFPKDAVLRRAEKELSSRLGKKVTIGDGGISFRPGLGIRLSSLSVGQPKDQEFPYIQIESLKVGLRLLPLLSRKIEIDSIAAEHPQVEMTLNPATEKDKAQAPAKGETSPSQGFGFLVRNLTIDRGEVKVFSADGKPMLQIGNLQENLEAQGNPGGVYQVKGETRIGSIDLILPVARFGQGLSLRFEKDLEFDSKLDRLRVKKAVLHVGDLPVAVEGTISQLTGTNPIADLTIAGGPANVANILGYLPANLFPAIEGISSRGIIGMTAAVQGPLGKTASTGELDFSAKLTLKEGHLVHPRLPAPVSNIEIDLTATPTLIEIAKFNAQSGKSTVQVTGVVRNYQEVPHLEIAAVLDANLKEVAGLRPELVSYGLTGQATARIKAQGPADPDKMTVDGLLLLKNVQAKAQEGIPALTNLNADIAFTSRDVQIKNAVAGIGSSDIQLQGKLNNFVALYQDAPPDRAAQVNLRLRSTYLNLDELIPAESKDKTSTPLPAAFYRLEGPLELRAGKMKVLKMEVRDVLCVARLDRGGLNLQNIDLKAFGGTIHSSGQLNARNLKKPVFDLKLGIKNVEANRLLEYASNLNKFGSLGKYISGRFDVDTQMRGSLTEQLELNLNDVSAEGNVKIQSAKLSGHPVQAKLADLLSASQLNNIAIQNWLQPFKIEGGKITFDGMTLAAAGIKVKASGWQNLDGNLQLSLDTTLPKSLASGIRSQLPGPATELLFGGGKEGGIELPFLVSGTINSPQVSLDQQKIASLVQQRLQQKLQDKAQDTLGDILQKQLPTSSQPKSGSKSARKKPKQKKAEDIFRGLLKKNN